MGAVTIDSLEIKLQTTSGKATKGLKGMSSAAINTSKSFVGLAAKITAGIVAVRKIGKYVASSVNSMNTYIENVNLFNVAMGEYAASAGAYAEQVQSVLGVDMSEFIRNEGVFMTLSTGFGVASDRAETMSQNLTQLGYDLSSFFNISTADAMQKLQSGLSGELEPLRRLGYDLSQAKLEATALELGITKAVSSMTQAEKAQLRYYAIMTQVTTAQGDMARTIESPANQLRVLKSQFDRTSRSIGGIFIPALTAVLPYINAVLRVIEELAYKVSSLFGFELPTFGDTGVEGLAAGAEDASEGLDDAAKSAKKLKQYTMGFDELNVIDPNSGSSGSGDESGGAGWVDFELPEYDFLGDATGGKINQIVDDFKAKMKEAIVVTDELQKSLDSAGTEHEIPVSFGAVAESGVLTAQNIVFGFIEEATNTINNTDWSGIASSITSRLSNIITSLDYSGLGSGFVNLGISVYTAINDVISGAIDGVDWGGLLDHLMTEARELVQSIGELDWGQMGTSLANVANSIHNAFVEVDWQKLGGDLWSLIKDLFVTCWNMLSQIDWGELATSLSKMIGGIIGGVAGFIWGFLNDLWADLETVWADVSDWFNKLANATEEEAMQIVGGMFQGIIDALATIGTWIEENIFNPFIEGFKEVFGIHSPSTVMAEQGGFLTAGILEGITAAWGNITSFFSEKWEALKTDMTNAWVSIKETALEKWTNIKDKLVEKVVDIKNSLYEKFTDVKDSISKIWTDLKDSIYSTINILLSGIEGMANGVVKGINAVLKALNKLQIDVPDWVTDLTGVTAFGFNFKMIDEVQIPRLMANGGFVDKGDLFISREAGPEMVGSIGRRTAVANNDQIVAGITTGVAEANSEQNSLLREQNSLLRALLEKDTSTNIDGRRLSKELNRVNKGMGATLISGGAY